MSALTSTAPPSVTATPAAAPHANTLQVAAGIAIEEDRPIMLDYWKDSIDKKAFLGFYSQEQRILAKGPEEYTTMISKLYQPKGTDDFICVTENSIYIVSKNIPRKKVLKEQMPMD